MKFTEAQLEKAFTDLLDIEDYPHHSGQSLQRDKEDVLLLNDLRAYLQRRYEAEDLSPQEIEGIVRELQRFPASDLYESNKAFMKLLCDGFLLKREDPNQKDLYIQLIDYRDLGRDLQAREEFLSTVVLDPPAPQDINIYKFVTQLEISGYEKRIPDGILYINGLPLVVFEFKSAIREETTLHDAYTQLTVRYQRDIPELFKYNAFCVISDGVNNKAGSLYAPYELFYAWRKISADLKEVDGFDSMHTLVHGMLNKNTLRDILNNFIYLPDSSKNNQKILCRYPQYFAAGKLFDNIKKHQRPNGDGKGGTYFGATGCGKSYTMLYLTRLLMRSTHFSSPTIILITDRSDLDDQLSEQFTNAKSFIGDNAVISVESRAHLRELLSGRNSGGVFLTTIHKFNEDTQLLTERTNVICISDEAHRSQTNLDLKLKVSDKGLSKRYGFAKHLRNSLPNATYVGFTGTPIDATLEVFGDVVDAYTMTESVKDNITVPIVYEGRAAKVLLNNKKLQDIEEYYNRCAEEGSNQHQVEASKKAMAQMNAIIGDPSRLEDLAKDFVQHYEKRVTEGASVKGKAMFVCSNREIAWQFYNNVIVLRPEWAVAKASEEGAELTEQEQKEIKPMARIKLVMTRAKDDDAAQYKELGTAQDRKELDRQFKNGKSNFKIAIVVDMWLTGFDVPFLDTIYIDKPIQRHNLIQTISRVNRKYGSKEKGLVVDYIGIKRQMNLALAMYNKADGQNVEEIEQSIAAVKDQLDLLDRIFHQFDTTDYYKGSALEQLQVLKNAAEFVQLTQELEKRFMNLVKRLKAAFDICSGNEAFSHNERERIHFYLAVRSIVFKLTKGTAPDIEQMNAKVRKLIQAAIESEGVEEIFKLGDDKQKEIDIFDEDYLAKIDKIKLPNTKLKLLQKLLAKAIDEIRRVNKMMGVEFSKRLQLLVEKYNERKEADVLQGRVLEDFTDEIINLYYLLKKEKQSFFDLGIDFEEKAFYDILKALAIKYDFVYPEEKLVPLAQKVKAVVDDLSKYTDWSKREDIKAELKADLIMLLAENDYPPVDRDEVYKEIFEQAENFKKYSKKKNDQASTDENPVKTTKFFNEVKGFGFIKDNDDDASKETFVHVSGLKEFLIDNRGTIETGSLEDNDDNRYIKYKVLYGTNRQKDYSSDEINYIGQRDSKLHLGTCLVSVPKSHKVGELERPGWFRKLFFDESPDKHFTILDNQQLSEADFITQLKTKVQQSEENDALLFVHGFNVDYKEAMLRTAQLGYDLNFKGAVTAFSWPSLGKVVDYVADSDSARYSYTYLRDFIKLLLKPEVKKLHIIAHSMGSVVLTEALKELSLQGLLPNGVINEVILAAPDIDKDLFMQQILPAVNNKLRLTVYASKKDKALIASKKLRAGYTRLGEGGKNIVVETGFDSVDASLVDTSLLGHGYFADTQSLLYDIHSVFLGLSPSQRILDSKDITVNGLKKKYWVFRRT